MGQQREIQIPESLLVQHSNSNSNSVSSASIIVGIASPTSHSLPRQPFSFITPDVVEASCQCMLAQAEESERRGVSEADTEAMIIEEFGRCLAQIIDMGNRTKSFGGGGVGVNNSTKL